MDIASMVADSLSQVADKHRFRDNPAEYLSLFGKYWGKQVDIMESVRDNRITLVRSANDTGKTYTAAATILWFLDVYRPHCKVITTAKTYGSVRFMLWTRIREMYKKVEHRFSKARMGVTDFLPDPSNHPEWFSIGYNPKIESDEATSFQGHHAKNILFLVDEAITTHPAIWRAIEGSLLSTGSRLLAIYNPTTTAGEVYQMERDKRGHLITISAFDLFKDPEWKKDPDYFSQLVSPDAVESLIESYGEESPLVQARIYGEWADEDDTTAISYAGVHKVTERAKTKKIKQKNIEKYVFSWDVAGEGKDDNVIGLMSCGSKNLRYELLKVWNAPHDQSLGIVNEIIGEYMQNFGVEKYDFHLVVDTIGEGSHVPSILSQWMPELTIHSFKAGASSKLVTERREMTLMNAISEAWYRSHLLIEEKIEGWPKLIAKFDPRTINELTTRAKYWGMRNKEPLVWSIEPKEEYKSRNRNVSPDRADAFVMAVYGYFHSHGMRMFSL